MTDTVKMALERARDRLNYLGDDDRDLLIEITKALEQAGDPVAGDPLRGALEGSFCVTESNGHPEPTSRSYRMIFSFPTMEAMHVAHAAYITGEAPLPTVEAGKAEPAAWTGSGSMAALMDGREGFIWPAKADAHPIPLFVRPPGEVIALQLDRKVGMKGCAYDPPGPCRAYTYEHQPSNLPAYSLGRAHAAAAAMSAGDNIDRGLGLLKALEEHGFGVFEIEQGGAGND